MDLFEMLLARTGKGGGGGGGTSDYTQLSNKPKINSVELDGNKSLADIGAEPKIDSNNKLASDLVDDTDNTNKFVTTQQISKIDTIGNVYHIGVGQEYTTLREGLKAAIQERNSIVYVHDGTYDLAQEFATEIEANVPNSEFGIELEKDIHIIFSSGAYVTAEYTGAYNNIVMCFAPFMARDDGGYIIENLRMSAKNVRYCIHDEGNGFTLPRNVKILNSQLKMDNTTAPLAWYPQCIGGGFGISDNILIDNCVFESISSLAKPYPALSYHNNGSIPTGSSSHCHLVVSNCYFVDGTFRITHYGNSTYKSVGYINNCNLPSAPIIKYETSTTSTPENVELISENNIIRDEVARDINSNGTKNLNKQSDITAESTGFTSYYPISLPAGHYVVSLTKALTDTAAIALYDSNSETLIVQKTFTVGTGSDAWEFDLPSDATRFRVWFNAANDSLTNIMFCTKTAWDISNTNVPYIPTNAELSETINGQQNTTASGGNGYALINGIRLYASHTAPTGDIPDGSIGVGW